jgi:hypothetical protein
MGSTSSLWAVRRKTRAEIDKLEKEQEDVEERSQPWEELDQEIEVMKKKLHTLEFMIYNGGKYE